MKSLCLVFVLLVTSSLTFCQTLGPNCLSGSAIDCFSCESGYVLAKNSTSGYQSCYGCSPDCQSCQNAGPTKCDTCSQGFTLRSDSQTCSHCAANCIKCDVAGIGQCDPGSCQPGYGTMTLITNNSTICEACSSACVNCSSSGESCEICQPGFYLSTYATFSSCESCNDLLYCQTCSNYQTCTACLKGYTFNAQTKTCAVPTYTVTKTNSTGVIVSVVVCLTFAVVLGVLAFYRGKKVALANK